MMYFKKALFALLMVAFVAGCSSTQKSASSGDVGSSGGALAQNDADLGGSSSGRAR